MHCIIDPLAQCVELQITHDTSRSLQSLLLNKQVQLAQKLDKDFCCCVEVLAWPLDVVLQLLQLKLPNASLPKHNRPSPLQNGQVSLAVTPQAD